MSNKTLFVSLILAIATVLLVFFKSPSNASSTRGPAVSVSSQVSPQLKAISKNIIEPQTSDVLPTSPVVELASHPCTVPELEGEIHNEYQIRDDILKYIDDITNNNERARRAAIKFAYYENQSYYHSLNAEEAIAWDKKSSLAGWCLVISDPENWDQINKTIAKLMNNTMERQQYIHHIDETFFGGKILGSGMTESEETEKCRSGVY